MSYYPPKINDHFLRPRFAGAVLNASIVKRNASFVCGSVLQISLTVENEKIVQAQFKAAGCGYLSAAADVLCEKIVNRSIRDFKMIATQNYSRFAASLQNELGDFPADRKHCLELAIDTFFIILENFQISELSNWNGDDPLICVCFGVSEKTIVQTIEESNLQSFEEVKQKCRAGTGCGSCQVIIQDILDNLQLK